MSVLLSRAVLKRDAGFDAIADLLIPRDDDRRTGAAHRLVWSLFADGPDRRRDFLWHEEAPGTFLTLSERPPTDPRGLFDLDTRPFAPRLAAGDRLAFFLRANPVVAKREGGTTGRGRRHDVVMAEISALSPGRRAGPRAAALGWADREDGDGTDPAPVAWLRRQGERAGFAVEATAVLGYRQVRLPRDSVSGGKAADLRFSTVDLEGAITVTDPERLPAAIGQGFGKARAFGCGLMLVRRM